MFIENKPIIGKTNGKDSFGHITLENLSNPKSMIITLLGERLYPNSFDIFGHPNFTLEQEMLFIYKEQEMYRKYGNDYKLMAEIQYEKKEFNVPRQYFDTYGGIKDSLISMTTLNDMLNYRKIYWFLNKNNNNVESRLNEFIIFGCFYLDSFGQVWFVEKSDKTKLVVKNDIEYWSSFILNNVGSVMSSTKFIIPKEASVCPCCGETFSLEDIKSKYCRLIDGEYYHNSCYLRYRKLQEIDKFTRNMIGLIYKIEDYSFEEIPNGYCSQECCEHIPWFLFHTPDGDVKIGNRKRVIHVEWQKNYKKFDFSTLFASEDVTKWEQDGLCGIHAWGKDKCFEYLMRVLNVVNPAYKKW